MFRRYRIGTATVALALMGLGGLLLAGNLGARPAWESVLDWWPVLLIALGVEIVVRFSLGDATGAGPRWDAASLFLLVFLIGILAVGNLVAATPGIPDLLADALNTQVEAVSNQTVALAVIPGSTLAVNNAVGSVNVLPANDQHYRIEAAVHARAANADKAQELADTVTINVRNTGAGTVAVNVVRPAVSQYQAVTVELTVYVPDELSLDITQDTGTTQLDGLTGSVRVQKRLGTVNIAGTNGAVEIQQERGGSIEVKNTIGDVLVKGKGVIVTLDSITGNVDIAADFGRIHAARITGNVSVNDENGQVTVSQVSGSVEVTGSQTPVDASDVAGKLQIRTAHAPVRILAQELTSDIDVADEFGRVELMLPEDGYRLNLESSNGTISVPHADLEVERYTNRQVLRATVGTAASSDALWLVQAYTSNGSIIVRTQ